MYSFSPWLKRKAKHHRFFANPTTENAPLRSAFTDPPLTKKIIFLFLLLAGSVCLVFVVRMTFLSVVKHDVYTDIARENSLHKIYVASPRGLITDRSEELLVENTPQFSFLFEGSGISDFASYRERVRDSVGDAIRLPETVPDRPVVIADRIPFTEVLELKSKLSQFPEISLVVQPVRVYPFGEVLGPLLGYVGKASPDELTNDAYYSPADEVGKSGIERTFEEELRGEKGYRTVANDAFGSVIKTIEERRPRSPQNVQLTIDSKLQKHTYTALARVVGAAHAQGGVVLVSHIPSGDILAAAQYPSYDNNVFVERDSAAIEQLLNDPHQPLFLRMTAGRYPPGSILKTIVALAALQDEVITRQTTVVSTGMIKVGDFIFPDWKAGGHGRVNVVDALAESVNTFFYYAGGGYDDFRGLGIERLSAAFFSFGIDHLVNTGIEPESTGVVPTPEWKEQTAHEDWYVGDTYLTSIGQGGTLVTPIQVLRMISLIAGDGFAMPLHVMKERELASGVTAPFAPEYFGVVKEGLRKAVTAGSARGLDGMALPVAGKTGTAQHTPGKEPHAWFMGYAPYNQPEYAIVVLLEEGGDGSATAVPLAREVLAYLAEGFVLER